MRKELIEDTKKLIAEELAAANRKFRQNASTHESYAVTLEEAQEAEEELKNVAQMLSVVWEMTKQNAPKEQLEEAVTQLEEAATRMAAESIQTAAMAQKFKQFLNRPTFMSAAEPICFTSSAALAMPMAAGAGIATEQAAAATMATAGAGISIEISSKEIEGIGRGIMEEAQRRDKMKALGRI